MIPLCNEDLYVYINYINWSQGVNLIQIWQQKKGASHCCKATMARASSKPRVIVNTKNTTRPGWNWVKNPATWLCSKVLWIPMDSYLDTKKIKVPNSANMFEQMPNRGFLHYSSLHFFHLFWWTNSVDPPDVTTSSPKRAETQTPIQARGKRCWRQGKPVGAPSGYGSRHGQVIENTT